jgi:TldD protein
MSQKKTNYKINSQFIDIIDNIKNYLESKSLDYYDIRIEDNQSSVINIQNKIIKNVNENYISGVGIRIYKNQKLGFCSTNNINNYKEIIDKCIKDTLKTNKKTKLNEFAEKKINCKIKYTDFKNIDISKKSKELQKINIDFLKEQKINKNNIKILNSNLVYIEKLRKKYFINSNSYIYQEDPHIIMYSSITGMKNDVIENSNHRIGFLGGLEKINFKQKEDLLFKNNLKVQELLNSKPCPAIKSNILITPQISDLLAHECIGHAAEADVIINNSSILKIGQVLSNNKDITVIDDPTLKEFGYYKYDDEGIIAKPRTIIKKGVVNEYLTNIESAGELNMKSNGAARSESFNKMPIVRMSNTYFKEGKDKYKDILKEFNGYLLDGLAGGEVDPSIGTFMFGIKKAYKMKKGKILEKYKQASISGNILNYLKNIELLSNKVGKFDFGFCGKNAQTAFVSGSGPYMKINNAIIGGTKYE